MLVCYVQIVSRLDSQRKFQMFTLFSGRHVGAHPWRFHTELCKFVRNISTNICGLGECTDLKLGEVSSLFIFNRITISWLYPLNGFRFIFFIAWQWKPAIYMHDQRGKCWKYVDLKPFLSINISQHVLVYFRHDSCLLLRYLRLQQIHLLGTWVRYYQVVCGGGVGWGGGAYVKLNTTFRTGGDNSNKRCLGTKPKLFRESGDFSGNRDTWKFFGETRDNSGIMLHTWGPADDFFVHTTWRQSC